MLQVSILGHLGVAQVFHYQETIRYINQRCASKMIGEPNRLGERDSPNRPSTYPYFKGLYFAEVGLSNSLTPLARP